MWHACFPTIFQALIAGKPLDDILAVLIDGIESEFPEIQCSIFLLDEDRQHLCQGASGRLSVAYIEAMNGLKIGPCAGSCGKENVCPVTAA